MHQSPNIVEQAYRESISAMSGKERVARSMAMLKWTRDTIAREIRAQDPELTDEQIKLKVALRLYASDDQLCKMIENHLTEIANLSC